MYALFNQEGDTQLTKPHTTKHGAYIEALEKGYVVRSSADFWGDSEGIWLCGIIKEVENGEIS